MVSIIAVGTTFMKLPDEATLEKFNDSLAKPDPPPRPRVRLRWLDLGADVLLTALLLLSVWQGWSALIIPSGLILGTGLADFWLRHLPEPLWLTAVKRSDARGAA